MGRRQRKSMSFACLGFLFTPFGAAKEKEELWLRVAVRAPQPSRRARLAGFAIDLCARVNLCALTPLRRAADKKDDQSATCARAGSFARRPWNRTCAKCLARYSGGCYSSHQRRAASLCGCGATAAQSVSIRFSACSALSRCSASFLVSAFTILMPFTVTAVRRKHEPSARTATHAMQRLRVRPAAQRAARRGRTIFLDAVPLGLLLRHAAERGRERGLDLRGRRRVSRRPWAARALQLAPARPWWRRALPCEPLRAHSGSRASSVASPPACSSAPLRLQGGGAVARSVRAPKRRRLHNRDGMSSSAGMRGNTVPCPLGERARRAGAAAGCRKAGCGARTLAVELVLGPPP